MRILVLLLVLLTSVASASEATDKCRTDYLKQADVAVKKYVKVIDGEIEKSTKAGKLDEVTAIQKEKDTIAVDDPVTSVAKWEKNKSLATAAKSYNDELSKAKKAYISALEKVVVELTKQSKLDEAKEVKEIVEEVKLAEVKSWLVGTWKRNDGAVWVFDNNKTWIIRDSSCSGTWGYSDGMIILTPNYTREWVAKCRYNLADMSMVEGKFKFDKVMQ